MSASRAPRLGAATLTLLLGGAAPQGAVGCQCAAAPPPETGPAETARPETARPETARPEAARPEAPLPEEALPPAGAAVLVGVGDIADCGSAGDEATAGLIRAVLDARPEARVVALGDNAYPAGSLEQYRRCYLPSWGSFLSRTLAVPGNHDWLTPDAAGFRATFGLPAEGPLHRGLDFGGWRLLLLDTDCEHADACMAGSAQLTWLAGELALNRGRCTLVLGHHPRFSSGPHGSPAHLQPLWEVLVAGGADLILQGHDHLYERFAPLDAQGRPNAGGPRAITAGTGGRSAYPLAATPALGSELRHSGQAGVLVLGLEAAGYTFRFVTVDGRVVDSGRGECAKGP